MNSQNSECPDLKLFNEIAINISEDVSAAEIKAVENINEGINDIVRYLNTIDLVKLKSINDAFTAIKEQLHSAKKKNLSTKEISQLLKQYETYQIYYQDVMSRKQLVNMLLDKNQQDRLHVALTTHLTNRKKDEVEIQDKLESLDDLCKDFTAYGRFAFLKADELAIVAQMLDDLIVAINNSLTQIKNQNLKIQYEEYLSYLKQSKYEIKVCMTRYSSQYEMNQQLHGDEKQQINEIVKPPVADLNKSMRDSLDNNPMLRSMVVVPREIEENFVLLEKSSKTEQLRNNNDILLPLRLRINFLFDKQMLPANINPCLDSTLLLWLPNSQLNPKKERRTVLAYFADYQPDQLPVESTYFNSLENGLAECKKVVSSWISNYVNHIGNLCANVMTAIVPSNFNINKTLFNISNSVNQAYHFLLNPVHYYLNGTYQSATQLIRSNKTFYHSSHHAANLFQAVGMNINRNLHFISKYIPLANQVMSLVDHVHGFFYPNRRAVVDKYRKSVKPIKERAIQRRAIKEKKNDTIQFHVDAAPDAEIQPIDIFSVEEKVKAWQENIISLAWKIHKEIKNNKQSCFPFFKNNYYKLKKIHALLAIDEKIQQGKIQNFAQLQKEAANYMKDDNVIDGWFSRCKKLFSWILQDKSPLEFKYEMDIESRPTYKTMGRQL